MELVYLNDCPTTFLETTRGSVHIEQVRCFKTYVVFIGTVSPFFFKPQHHSVCSTFIMIFSRTMAEFSVLSDKIR